MSSRAKTPGQDEIRIAVTALDSLTVLSSCLILAASLWIRSVPAAKHHVQRVSYKIILWVLYAQCFYSVTRLALYTGDESRAFFARNSGMCVTGVYFFIKQLHFTNFLITCIALNLMLIVCFGINPIEKKLLRWYVGGSFAIASFIPLVPAVLGHFGQDPLYRICYFTPLDVDDRMRVVALDLVLWELISCVVASVAIIAVLVTLFKQGRRTAQALLHGNPINLDLNGSPNPTDKRPSKCPTFTSWGRRWRKDEKDVEAAQESSETHHLQDRFLGIALKISLYPIFLIIVNVIISVADLYFNYQLRNGLSTSTERAFLGVYQILYAGRGFFFAILCICIDPSFRSGLSAAWYAKRNALNAAHGRPADLGAAGDKMSFGQFLSSQNEALPPPNPRRESDKEVELSAALVNLPYTATYALPPLLDLSLTPSSTPDELAPATPSKRYTRKFAGVASDSLPTGLSDDVDVDLKLSYEPASPMRQRHLPRTTSDTVVERLSEVDEAEMVDFCVEKTEAEMADVLAEAAQRSVVADLRRPSDPAQAGAMSRSSVESRRRPRDEWFAGVDAKRRFKELNAQL